MSVKDKTVADVQAQFMPLADYVLSEGLSLNQIQRALSAVVVMRALEKHGQKQTIVADILGVSNTRISKLVLGQRTPPSKHKNHDWEKRHGGTPQQVLGGLEL